MDDLNKVLMTSGAYNAGPGRIRQLRRESETSIPIPGSTTSNGSPPSGSVANRLVSDQRDRRDAAKAEGGKRK